MLIHFIKSFCHFKFRTKLTLFTQQSRHFIETKVIEKLMIITLDPKLPAKRETVETDGAFLSYHQWISSVIKMSCTWRNRYPTSDDDVDVVSHMEICYADIARVFVHSVCVCVPVCMSVCVHAIVCSLYFSFVSPIVCFRFPKATISIGVVRLE